MENVFWEAFTAACKERNTSPSAVARALGLSSGSPTAWKRGATPNAFTIAQIASYLECPMQKFYGLVEPEQKENQPTGFDGLTEDEIQLLTAYRRIADEDKEAYLKIVVQRGGQNP